MKKVKKREKKKVVEEYNPPVCDSIVPGRPFNIVCFITQHHS